MLLETMGTDLATGIVSRDMLPLFVDAALETCTLASGQATIDQRRVQAEDPQGSTSA